MDSVSRDIQRLKQKFTSHPKVAFGIVRWNTPFVRPKEMDVAESCRTDFCLIRHGRKKLLRNTSPGKSDRVLALLPIRCFNLIQKSCCGRASQLVRAGKRCKIKRF